MEPRRSTGLTATKLHILDRPLSRGKNEVRTLTHMRHIRTQSVSLSAFSFLFSEMVQYFQGRVQNISDLENRLDDAGFGVGVRVGELLCHREKSGRRETRLINMLQFLVSTCWKALFGKAADALERSTENEDEYMIHELEPLTNKFISVPPDLGQLDCAAYIAGIIRGVLTSSGFTANVTAHTVEVGTPGQRDKTVFLIKFDERVMRRERVLT
ncbi:Trafficking protein particle complex subunit, partial [Globisporangium splendens]